MRKSNAPLILGLAAAAGGAALLLSRGASAKELPPGTKDDDKPDTADGFPDRAAEIRNAVLVAKAKPLTFPKNKPPHNARRPGQPLSAWLANVAYWTTYPVAPVVIPGPGKYADAWKRILGIVRLELVKQKKKDSDKGGDKTPGDVPDTTTPPKLNISSATEMRNAAIVSAEKPLVFEKNAPPYNKWKGSDAGQSLPAWLANVAYWTTYPNAPVRLDPKNGDHANYIKAWVRIHKHVKQALAKVAQLPAKAPVPKTLNEMAWKKWGAALALSSGVRSPAAIVDAYKKALRFVNADGAAVVSRDLGKPIGPYVVTLSGLLGEAAARVPGGKLSGLTNWRKNPSRAFLVTNTLF